MKPVIHCSLDELYREMAVRKAQRERWARAACYLLGPLLALVLHLVW